METRIERDEKKLSLAKRLGGAQDEKKEKHFSYYLGNKQVLNYNRDFLENLKEIIHLT